MDNIKDKNGLTEEEFLEAYKKKNYPRPYLTADIIVIGIIGDKKKLLLIQRGGHPYINMWALPSGFSRQTETMEQTAHRELFEETGVNSDCISPVGLFSRPGRDPRGWVVTQAYLAKVDFTKCKPPSVGFVFPGELLSTLFADWSAPESDRSTLPANRSDALSGK